MKHEDQEFDVVMVRLRDYKNPVMENVMAIELIPMGDPGRFYETNIYFNKPDVKETSDIAKEAGEIVLRVTDDLKKSKDEWALVRDGARIVIYLNGAEVMDGQESGWKDVPKVSGGAK